VQELAYKIKADFMKALAHPLRLQIIEALKNGEKNVGSLIKTLKVQQSSLSRHLTILREAGILRSRQNGTVVYYDIADHEIFQVLRPIAELLNNKLKRTQAVFKSLGRGEQ
jgi:ArsR family transcriptional regulator